MLTVQAVGPKLAVQLQGSAPFAPPEALKRIEDIWQAEKARRGDALSNGALFSIAHVSPELITGWLAEYRWFLAQRRDPSLYPLLRVNPLAVTGVLRCADGIVFGRRSGRVEMDASLWELAPSGGVDGRNAGATGEIDIGAHLAAEMEEETGIPPAALSAPPRPFAMVEDARSHVTDVGFILQVGYSADEVLGMFEALKNREYLELAVIAPARAPDFLALRGASISDVSRALLAAAMRQI